MVSASPPPQVEAAEHTVLTIPEIQGDGDATGYEGQTVTTTGTVTAVFDDGYFIQDGSGARSGIWIYDPNNRPLVGDEIEVTGTATEYYELTEIEASQVEVLSSGNPLPEPHTGTTQWFSSPDTGEDWEGVLVRVEGVTVTSARDQYGEWTIQDASAADLLVDNLGSETYEPTVDDTLAYVQGPLNYSFSNYKLAVRDDADLGMDQPLELQSAAAVSPTQVEVSFSQPVDTVDGLLNPASYQIEPALEVTSAQTAQGSTDTVQLETYEQTPGQVYTLTVQLDGSPAGSVDFTGFEPAGTNDPGEPYNGPVEVFHGDLHIHTGYSQDGSGDPRDAMDNARASGFDFMGITDHSYAISDGEWENLQAYTDEKTEPGAFVAIRGFEYTHGSDGHLNVFNTGTHAIRQPLTDSAATGQYAASTPTLQSFYDWVATQPGAIVEFNHPGWMNFQDFAYRPDIEEQLQLLEVGNGFEDSYVYAEKQYLRALDYGWKVGATNNSDYHGNLGTEYYGNITSHRTGVLLPEGTENDPALTQANLLDAIRSMRTFATEDSNFAVTMKADGQWQGSILDNDGQINFEVSYNDGDGETIESLELVGDQGQVWAETQPAASSGSWSPQVETGPGVYYFYVRAKQSDGDRLITSPVWTRGTEDVAVTDIEVSPALPSTQQPAQVTVRLTNRGQSDARGLNVSLAIDGTEVASQTVDVPTLSEQSSGDTQLSFAWQPQSGGEHELSLRITGVPEGDNLDDNIRTVSVETTDETVPLVIIDGGNRNFGTTDDTLQPLRDALIEAGFNSVVTDGELTPAKLTGASVLLLPAPISDSSEYSAEERQTVADYVNNGGKLWMAGISDYDDGDANQELNAIIDQIGGINARFNDDEVVDGDDNNGYAWGVTWHVFPHASDLGPGLNVSAATSWSEASLIDAQGGALTEDDGVTLFVTGDTDEGSTQDTRNATHNIEADDGYEGESGDAYLYEPWNDGIPVPLVAGQTLDNGGRVLLWGSVQDTFDSWAYSEDDGKQNELLNEQALRWLLADPVTVNPVAEVRAASTPDQPDQEGKLAAIEGTVTAGYGTFLDVLYVQDETGGITVFAPVSGLSSEQLSPGSRIRVVGRVQQYEGDTELEVSIPGAVQVLEPGDESDRPAPKVVTVEQAASEALEGSYLQTEGEVVEKLSDYAFVLQDPGSKATATVFIPGSLGRFEKVAVGDYLSVTGFGWENNDGYDLRVTGPGAVTAAERSTIELNLETPEPDTTITGPVLSIRGKAASQMGIAGLTAAVIGPLGSDQSSVEAGTLRYDERTGIFQGRINLRQITAKTKSRAEARFQLVVQAFDREGNVSEQIVPFTSDP